MSVVINKLNIFGLLLLLSAVFYVKCDLGLKEGDPCSTGGVNGTCLNIFKCKVAAITYLYRNAGFNETFPELPDFCSQTTEDPIVCCTECSIDHSKTYKKNAIGPLGVAVRLDGPTSWNKCYERFGKLPYPCRGYGNVQVTKKWNSEKKCYDLDALRVALAVGGRDAQRWEFPHMALLGYGDDTESAQWLCGGTIISERFILTAGHCSFAPKIGSIKYATLGILKRTDPKELWNKYAVKRIIVHPEYKPPSKYHDIALLETDTEITFGKNVLPACLDIGRRTYTNRAEAAGWGRLGHRQELADTLQVIEVQEFPEKECFEIYSPHRHLQFGYNHSIQCCFGSRSMVIDTCEGDSGGPLQDNNARCLYTVVGVTSYGKSCGTIGIPGIYTRVEFYVPWIESIVWPEKSYGSDTITWPDD